MSIKNPIIIIGLAILSLYLFFFQLGGMALTDPDETFYAQTAKEMLSRNEWITPYLYDKPQFEKPILFYWLVLTSYKIFGLSEFAARFPSAIFGFLGLVAAYFLGAILFNKRTGLFAALILATSVEYLILSRACVTDMVLGALIAFGFLFFLVGYLKGRRYGYLLSSALFGLAVLTKGPIGALLPTAIIIAYLFFTRDMKVLRRMGLVWCAVVFAAVTLPWYLAAYRLHGREFMDAFFGFHNVTRFLESEHEIGSQFYYNIPIVFGGLFPWSAFLPVGIWQAFKKVNAEKNQSVFLLTWFFVIFGFFSVSKTKLPTYIFPCFSALALIAAHAWDVFLQNDAAPKLTRGMKFSYYFLIGIIFLGMAGFYLFIKARYPSILTGAVISAVVLILGMALSFVSFRRGKFPASFFLIVFSVLLFLYPLVKLVVPEIERYETTKEISERLLSFMKPNEALGAEGNYLAGLAFYTGKTPIDLDKHHILQNLINSKERGWAVLKEKNHIQLYDPVINPSHTKPSYMVYKFGKKCIVTNQVPDDGVYLVRREMPYENR